MKITLQGIARQSSGEALMEELLNGEISVDEGLLGDCSAGCGDGEISVLSNESWTQVCDDADMLLPWLVHGANLLVRGFEFLPTDAGRILRIGETELEVDRAMAPNSALANQVPELFHALQSGWRGGVICRVRRGGSIRNGDNVVIME